MLIKAKKKYKKV